MGMYRLPHSWWSRGMTLLCSYAKSDISGWQNEGFPQQVLVFFWLLKFTPSEGWIFEIPKPIVIAPHLLAPEDQPRPRAGYKKVFAFPLREMPSQPEPSKMHCQRWMKGGFLKVRTRRSTMALGRNCYGVLVCIFMGSAWWKRNIQIFHKWQACGVLLGCRKRAKASFL